jgi:GH24 family phage-related lysozyme (muramidase)
MSKLVATKRGKGMIVAAALAAATGGWGAFKSAHLSPAHPEVTPVIIHQAVTKGVHPPAVLLAVALIKKWEGLRLTAYIDMVGVATVCYGETLIGGKPVKLGMTFTAAQCETMLITRVERDYYLPLVDHVQDFVKAPDSVQAALASLAYNVGVGPVRPSSSARDVSSYAYRQACDDLGKWDKAGGRKVKGLTNRRGMGDPGRAGEGEVCVSGL